MGLRLSHSWTMGLDIRSENNRRARYYTLNAVGRKQLSAEREECERLIGAIQKVLQTA
jgi:PadR family transcriptional regulator PadR